MGNICFRSSSILEYKVRISIKFNDYVHVKRIIKLTFVSIKINKFHTLYNYIKLFYHLYMTYFLILILILMYTTKDFQISFIFTVKKKYILFSEKKLYSYVLPKWKSDVHIGISKLISITTYKFHFYLNLLNLKNILKIIKIYINNFLNINKSLVQMKLNSTSF